MSPTGRDSRSASPAPVRFTLPSDHRGEAVERAIALAQIEEVRRREFLVRIAARQVMLPDRERGGRAPDTAAARAARRSAR